VTDCICHLSSTVLIKVLKYFSGTCVLVLKYQHTVVLIYLYLSTFLPKYLVLVLKYEFLVLMASLPIVIAFLLLINYVTSDLDL